MKFMIISVGGSPEPIVTSLLKHRPDFVCFFATQRSMDRIGDIKEKTKEQAVVFDDCKVLADDENDDDAVVRLFRALDMAGQIGHPQGDRFEAHRQTFENLLYTRNHSILAHGLTPIKADTAASFRQKMTEIFLDAPLIRFPQELHW